MRGKGAENNFNPMSNRITPAYAGKSLQFALLHFGMWDHPRLCGEKGAIYENEIRVMGSPPPMRGKVSKPLDVIGTPGITPAYAGKSLQPETAIQIRRDHPRLCGEKTAAGKFVKNMMGSPPPMRGKGLFQNDLEQHQRITPAYAGKSKKATQYIGMKQDHPRLCGEKTKKITKQRYFFHQPASFSFSLQYT